MKDPENKITLYCGECEAKMLVNPGMDLHVHFCWSCLHKRKERLKMQMKIQPIVVLVLSLIIYAILPSILFFKIALYGGIPALAFALKPIFDYRSNKKEIEDYNDAGVRSLNEKNEG